MKYITSLLFMSLSLHLMSQVEVSKVKENKNVLLEMIPGIKCPFCPDADLRADYLISKHGEDNLYVMAIHGWSYAQGPPDFKTNYGDSLIGPFVKITIGVPCGNINRSSNGCMSRTLWDDSISVQLQLMSPVNIGVGSYFYEGDSTINIDVAIYFTDSVKSKSGLHIAVLQDSIIAPQLGGSTYYPSRVLPNGDYLHMNVFRKMITPFHGYEIDPHNEGDQVDLQFTYKVKQIKDIPVDIANMKIIAFVTDEPELYSEIYTVGGSRALERPVGIAESALKSEISIYPNPSNGIVNLASSNDYLGYVRILNAVGKIEFENDFSNEYSAQIHLPQHLTRGVYIVQISNLNSVHTTKIIYK